MRERAAHEYRMQHVREIKVGNELPLPREQATILAARQRTPDKRSIASFVHA
jgi:hypothetical protein